MNAFLSHQLSEISFRRLVCIMHFYNRRMGLRLIIISLLYHRITLLHPSWLSYSYFDATNSSTDEFLLFHLWLDFFASFIARVLAYGISAEVVNFVGNFLHFFVQILLPGPICIPLERLSLEYHLHIFWHHCSPLPPKGKSQQSLGVVLLLFGGLRAFHRSATSFNPIFLRSPDPQSIFLSSVRFWWWQAKFSRSIRNYICLEGHVYRSFLWQPMPPDWGLQWAIGTAILYRMDHSAPRFVLWVILKGTFWQSNLRHSVVQVPFVHMRPSA